MIFVMIFITELMFLETSALTGENVEEAFLKCSRTILSKIESGKETTFMKMSVIYVETRCAVKYALRVVCSGMMHYNLW